VSNGAVLAALLGIGLGSGGALAGANRTFLKEGRQSVGAEAKRQSAPTQAKAVFVTPPTVEIAKWRENAKFAYSLVHDDACAGSKGPPAYGTWGILENWKEAAVRGLRIGLGAVGSECAQYPGYQSVLKSAVTAGYEIYSHSWFHCRQRDIDTPETCETWSEDAQAMVPLTAKYPPAQYPEITGSQESLVRYEMNQSKDWLSQNIGTVVRSYAFPEDISTDPWSLERLRDTGYMSGRGGTRATCTFTGAAPYSPDCNINWWNFRPTSDDLSYWDYRLLWDEYGPANISEYPPEATSLKNYLDAVESQEGSWGIQVLHGIGDNSYGAISLVDYQSHLSYVLSRTDLWVASPTDVVRYRRTNYHCTNGYSPISVEANGDLTFAGVGGASCANYGTEVTVNITLPTGGGMSAITATQNGQALGVSHVRTDSGGNHVVSINANPAAGTINIQPVSSSVAPLVTSTNTATFAVGAPTVPFTLSATGMPAPAFSVQGTLPSGLTLNPITGVISGTPTMAGSFTRIVTAGNGASPNATQAFTFVINKGDQTITFVNPITFLNVDGVDAIAATATSKLDVSFASATPQYCTVSNVDLTVTAVSVGTCIIKATQAGDSDWNPAPEAELRIFIKDVQTIAFVGAAPTMVVGGTGTVAATSTAGLPVQLTTWSSEVCTISGNMVTGHAAGSCTVAANQAGNDYYYPAEEKTLEFPIGKGSQVIVFGAAPSVSVGGAGTLSASATSALQVIFTSLSASVCTAFENTVTGIAPGLCRIAANQSGNIDWNPAAEQVQEFQVAKGTPLMSLVTEKPQSVFGDSVTFTATLAGTPLPSGTVTFKDGASVICQSVGLNATFAYAVCSTSSLQAGAHVISAEYEGSTAYNPTMRTLPQEVGKRAQTISFGLAPAVVVGRKGTVTVAATSGLPVVLTSKTQGICTVSGVEVTGVSAGLCVVAGNQEGNSNYSAAPEATLNISIGGGTQATLTATAQPAVIAYNDTSTLGATGGSGTGVVSFSVTAGANICSITGATLRGIGVGTCTVTATKSADVNYNAATATVNVTVIKANQVVTFGAIPTVPVGGTGTVAASASSGLPVVFGSTTPTICTISGNVVKGVAAGICTITGNQAGDANWSAAQASQSFGVGKGTQTIVFGAAPTVGVSDTGTVAATATSGLPVTFTSKTTGICTVSGSTVNGVAKGLCVIAANQPGDGNYSAAPEATQNISIGGGNQAALTAVAQPQTIPYNGSSALGTTGGSGTGAVTYAVTGGASFCSISGSKLTGTGVGACTVTATKSADANFNAAVATVNVTVVKANQSVAFGTAPSVPLGGTGSVSVQATSGLPVVLTSKTPNVCKISGSFVTGAAAGSCTIAGNQPGGENWNPAPEATLTFGIGKGSQTIVFGNPPTVVVGGKGTVTATASSGLPVAFTSQTTQACTVSGSEVTGIAAGLCTIAANQVGDDNYNAAPEVTQSFNIGVGGAAVTRYRVYNPDTLEHLYTTSAFEYAYLSNQVDPSCCGWKPEGPIYMVFSAPVSYGGVAVVPYYRLYNPYSYQHHWTTDEVEYAFLPTYGWKQEGLDGYVLPAQASGSIPLYRLYLNAAGGLHLWTTDSNEVSYLTTNAGWVYEGVSGYVIPLP
jgi:hypothetical protein